MAEILISGKNGLIEKYLAWDQAQGDQSKTAQKAYEIYLERLKQGIPGSAVDDWQKAEQMVAKVFEDSLTPQLA